MLEKGGPVSGFAFFICRAGSAHSSLCKRAAAQKNKARTKRAKKDFHRCLPKEAIEV
jgi:hypothetical protein